ncbi:TPA: hypothetical protein O7S29_003372 [Salmonella enterica]|nr:hypothetical protein [Salmonella enterica]
MKKLTMAVAAAALTIVTATNANAAISDTKTKTTSDATNTVVLHAQYTVREGASTTNSVFNTKLDTSASLARPIGYFTINGLTDGDTYELSRVTATGADSSNVAPTACFLSNPGDTSTTCAGADTVLNDASNASPAYVQIDHTASKAIAGETYITVTAAAYKS